MKVKFKVQKALEEKYGRDVYYWSWNKLITTFNKDNQEKKDSE